MADMRKKPGEGGVWKLIKRKRMSTKLVMTREGTADAKSWRGWEVKEVGMKAKITAKSEARY